MTDTPIAILQKSRGPRAEAQFHAARHAGRESLRSMAEEFADTLRLYKAQLLDLLRLPFVMVFSQILGETIFFCADERHQRGVGRGRRRGVEHLH